jgi:pimeloyl-ACP methyl ester carboxylesterase
MNDIAEVPSAIQLRDGRALAYLEVGNPRGPAIFHFHGHGSSRLEALFLARDASELGVCVIGVDRPGIGGSGPNLGDALRDWPDDVAQLADHLGVQRFAVLGVSGGGPYALECAHSIPHRLTACGLVSTQVPSNIVLRAGHRWMRAAWRLESHFPGAIQAILSLADYVSFPTLQTVDRRFRFLAILASKRDRQLMRTDALRSILARAVVEGNRQGRAAYRAEAERQTRPWGFALDSMAFERIFLWHGDDDRICSVSAARMLAQMLPHCHAVIYPGEGHFSVLVYHAREILSTLAA